MAEEQVKVIKINWRELFGAIPGFQCGEGLSNRLEIEREIIPIIFVPGIMGSRLRDAAGKKVWDPDDALFMVNTYGKFSVTAQQRKALVVGERFDMNYLTVFEDDAEHNKKFADKQDAGRAAWPFHASGRQRCSAPASGAKMFTLLINETLSISK